MSSTRVSMYSVTVPQFYWDRAIHLNRTHTRHSVVLSVVVALLATCRCFDRNSWVVHLSASQSVSPFSTEKGNEKKERMKRKGLNRPIFFFTCSHKRQRARSHARQRKAAALLYETNARAITNCGSSACTQTKISRARLLFTLCFLRHPRVTRQACTGTPVRVVLAPHVPSRRHYFHLRTVQCSTVAKVDNVVKKCTYVEAIPNYWGNSVCVPASLRLFSHTVNNWWIVDKHKLYSFFATMTVRYAANKE